MPTPPRAKPDLTTSFFRGAFLDPMRGPSLGHAAGGTSPCLALGKVGVVASGSFQILPFFCLDWCWTAPSLAGVFVRFFTRLP